MAILTKAAPVLQVENFVDIMPVAWELLLETDQELAAAAGEYSGFQHGPFCRAAILFYPVVSRYTPTDSFKI